MTVAKVFAGIIVCLCLPVIGIPGIVTLTSTVETQTQSPLFSATPLAAAPGTNSEFKLRLVFYGYPRIAVPQSGAGVISETGLSNIHDITFTSIGGELSPNGRLIAYDNCVNARRGIYVAEPDGSNAQLVVPLSGRTCIDVRWSPDSAKLSYPSQRDRSLRVFDIANKTDTLIPNTQGADWHWWSPGGNEIVFGKTDRRGQVGPVGRLLYITDLRGSSRQLTFAKDFVPCDRYHIIDTWAPVWSPNGNAIAFTACERLFVISSGNDLRQLTTPRYESRPPTRMPVTSAYGPRWSPDGRWIIFIGDGEVLKRISADGNTIVDIGKLPYRGGPFSIAPLQ